MADISVVADKLFDFETANDLAEFFRGYGIIAQPRNARKCAITKFVMEETGLEHVSTNQSSITVYKHFDSMDYDTQIKHTNAMAEFVERYDKGDFEYLVEEGYEVVEDSMTGCNCPDCK